MFQSWVNTKDFIVDLELLKQLIAWRRVLVEKLIFSQLYKKFTIFHRTDVYIRKANC